MSILPVCCCGDSEICLANEHTYRKCICQCFAAKQHCDSQEDCLNQVDEINCDRVFNTRWNTPPPPPAVITLHVDGDTSFLPINVTHETWRVCPETHYQCAGDGYCLPVFTRCNGLYDCPGREDEEGCQMPTCIGYYRCVCVCVWGGGWGWE